MPPLTLISAPPNAGGRPKVAGTILARATGERLCLVRQIFAGASNAGNTGSPAVLVWIALGECPERPFAPVGVRRVGIGGGGGLGGSWAEVGEGELRWATGADGIYAATWRHHLARMLMRPADLWDATAPHWPTTTMDRRVVLPGDGRWKNSLVSPSILAALDDLQQRRNVCPDPLVWAIDAQILSLAPKYA